MLIDILFLILANGTIIVEDLRAPPHINPTWICPNGQSGIPPMCN